MKKVINLPNRYYADNALVQDDDKPDVYYFNGKDSYMRVIYEDDDQNNIVAIDPDGGPMIGVGSKLDEFVVDKISFDDDRKAWKFVLRQRVGRYK